MMNHVPGELVNSIYLKLMKIERESEHWIYLHRFSVDFVSKPLVWNKNLTKEHGYEMLAPETIQEQYLLVKIQFTGLKMEYYLTFDQDSKHSGFWGYHIKHYKKVISKDMYDELSNKIGNAFEEAYAEVYSDKEEVNAEIQ